MSGGRHLSPEMEAFRIYQERQNARLFQDRKADIVSLACGCFWLICAGIALLAEMSDGAFYSALILSGVWFAAARIKERR